MAREFTAILGDMGSGKSTLLTWLLYQDHLAGYTIYSDMLSLKFPYHSVDFEWFANFTDHKISSARIGMDELSEGADAYDFWTQRSRNISRTVSQLRKTLSMVYYTDQRFSKIPKRLREITNGFIFCTDLDAKKPNHTFDNCDSQFQLDIYDGDLIYIKTVIFNGKPVQHLFDSREIINGKQRKDKSDAE